MFKLNAVSRLLLNDRDIDKYGLKGPLEDSGWWSRSAAGALILARSTGRILLQHRSNEDDAPGTWGAFGGGMDNNESPESAIKREFIEETGVDFERTPYRLQSLMTSRGDDCTYYNFLATIDEEFEPVINDETQGFEWCEFGEWPTPLHPGIIALFEDQRAYRIISDAVKTVKILLKVSP